MSAVIDNQYIKVPSVTTTERDALTAVNGMIVYNTTVGAFQKYEASAWVSFGTGSNTFVDSSFNITGSSDATKVVKFEVDGLTTATTRTQTVQDQNGTIQLNTDGNIVPNSSFENWERGIAAAPDSWVLTGASATVAQEGTLIKHGTYSAKITRSGTDCHLSADLYTLGGKTYMRSRVYTLGAWVYATVASRVRLRVNDGTTTTNSSYHSGGSAWEYLTCSFTVGSGATALNVGLAVDTGNTSGYIDGVVIEEGLSAPNYTPTRKPFNRFPRNYEVTGRALRQPVGTAGITNQVNASQILNGYWFNTTQALNDALEFSCWLEAGTYTFNHIGITASSAGQITWAVDGVDQGALTNVDWYSAGATFNVIKTGSITVVGDGYHVFRGRLAAKNGSSSGYNWFVTLISIVPSAD